MNFNYTITYEQITEESAAYGDASERGWYHETLRYPLDDKDGRHPETLARAVAQQFVHRCTSLKDFIAETEDFGPFETSTSPLNATDPDQQFDGVWLIGAEIINDLTGVHEIFNLHFHRWKPRNVRRVLSILDLLRK